MKRLFKIPGLFFLLSLLTVNALASTKWETDSNKLIAHRGLWSKGYEQNSKEGIEAALLSNIAGFECDIRQTSDGYLILNHDNEVGTLNIDSSSFLDLKSEPNAVLPLLSDILELKSIFPEKIMYAEIKAGNVNDILKEFEKYNIKDNVIFKSFDKDICIEVIENTDIPVYILSADSSLNCKALKNEGFQGVSLMYSDGETSPELIRSIHDAGLKVAFWTINNKNLANQLIEWGADHIISDLNF